MKTRCLFDELASLFDSLVIRERNLFLRRFPWIMHRMPSFPTPETAMTLVSETMAVQVRLLIFPMEPLACLPFYCHRRRCSVSGRWRRTKGKEFLIIISSLDLTKGRLLFDLSRKRERNRTHSSRQHLKSLIDLVEELQEIPSSWDSSLRAKERKLSKFSRVNIKTNSGENTKSKKRNKIHLLFTFFDFLPFLETFKKLQLLFPGLESFSKDKIDFSVEELSKKTQTGKGILEGSSLRFISREKCYAFHFSRSRLEFQVSFSSFQFFLSFDASLSSKLFPNMHQEG